MNACIFTSKSNATVDKNFGCTPAAAKERERKRKWAKNHDGANKLNLLSRDLCLPPGSRVTNFRLFANYFETIRCYF